MSSEVCIYIGMGVLILLLLIVTGILAFLYKHKMPDYSELKKAMSELEYAKMESEKAKAKALEANRAKSIFLSQMSHEIRTPINAILGYNGLILDDTAEVSTREYAGKVEAAAYGLLNFFKDVLDHVGDEDEAGTEDFRAENFFESITNEKYRSKEAKEAYHDAAAEKENKLLSILIVDDTEMNVDLLNRILVKLGYVTDSAGNGKEAIEKIKGNDYDLIFMDHMMPVMDGVEALKIIRDDKLCENTPVVMLTANALEGESEKYIREGFDAFITKPFTEETIQQTLKKFVPIPNSIKRTVSAAFKDAEWVTSHLPFLSESAFSRYCMEDISFYLKMISIYSESDVMQRIKQAFSEDDKERYRAYLRELRDMTGIIGARDLRHLARDIETASHTGSRQQLNAMQKKLEDEYGELLERIRTALAGIRFEGEYQTRQVSGDSYETAVKTDMRPRVLVVDDDDVIADAAANILGSIYDVDIVYSGREAVKYAMDTPPALILLDIMMPDMDGFEVIELLKKSRRTSSIPVVLLTQDTDRDTEIKGFKLGVQDYVRKPFVADVLLQRIRRVIDLDYLQRFLQREVAEQTKKVGHLSKEIMIALSKAVDAKDHATDGHSLRVARYSAEIARRLGKSRKEQDDIYSMGLIHDVGKLAVHESIINKPGRLSDAEYEEIKTHTTIGYDILKSITEMPGLAEAARWHHERYDGRGYPDGLVGEDIPETARIICIADCYDAMTSRRSYSKIRNQQTVREEIIKNSGTQFDPRIAEVLISMIDDDPDYSLSEHTDNASAKEGAAP